MKRIPFRNVSYIGETSQLIAWFQRRPRLCDLVVLLLSIGMIWGLVAYFHRFSEAFVSSVDIDLSPWQLPKYTFFSMSRGLLGYILSLFFSLLVGFWAAKDRAAERALIPALDILQSIPILGFMPGLVLLLVGLFPQNNTGLELAAILMIFTSQVWNMAFSVYHSLRIIPQDKIDCATVYKFSASQRLRWLELPSLVISLLWNSIMSMAGGWFFLIVNEAFQLGKRDFRLPGLGAYMSAAVDAGDMFAILLAIFAMIALILFLDTLLWKPLVAWSQKFRIEETSGASRSESLFLEILRHSPCVQSMRKLWRAPRHIKWPRIPALAISRTCLFALLSSILVALLFLLREAIEVPPFQWLHLGHMALLTFGRVISCILIGASLAIPLGLWIGLSEKISTRLEPVIQIAASFPATLLFPVLILLFQHIDLPLNIGATLLMLLGSFSYILFNVLAGAKAIPSDLKEVATTFRLSLWPTYKRLYLPAIFPYLITGLISAAGGAWNASIVAEYVSYKHKILTIPGLGSTINESAQQENIPLLIASILVMSSVVVLLNYQVWLKLYHYSEKRFALNY